MILIRECISRPVGVSVGVLLVVLFGLLSLFQIPVQLTPSVDIPIITVKTRWTGASPQEIEREIIDRQEEQLRGVKGLREMRSTSRDGLGEITLEFYNDVNRDVALRDVNDKLRQVTNYPPEADEPTVAAADTARDSEIAWLILYPTTGEDEPATRLYDFARDHIKPYLDRVDGVGSTDIFGGREREVHVRVDAGRLAARGLTFAQLEQALRRENANLSAGTIAQGKRDYTVRTLGQYESVAQILNTIVAYTPGGPVYVRDVADVEESFVKQYAFVRSKGRYVLAFPVRREVGANVVRVMAGLREAVRRVNDEVLRARGLNLELAQVYDETVYIDQAIAMVRTNIFVGGSLAGVVLLLFLRNWRAVAVLALAIPISVIGTFLAVASTGRTMNVVSLAGMAFAVGMVVDSAIVVLENIYRHYRMGKTTRQAAYDGAREVWAAVLAGTLTTMAVFIPVIAVREEAGQLFQDISVAIVAAVGLSLLVSITVVPTLATRLLQWGTGRPAGRRAARPESTSAAPRPGRVVGAVVHGVIDRPVLRGVAVAALVGLSVGLTPLLVPQTTYLPQGNRNLVFGFLITPPGYSIDEFKRMGDIVEARLRPYWEVAPGSPEHRALDDRWRAEVDELIRAGRIPELAAPPAPGFSIERRLQRDRLEREWRTPPPLIDNFFFVAYGGGCFMGCTSRDPARVKPLVRLLQTAGAQIPGVYPVFLQTAIFRVGAGNDVEVQIRGDNLEHVTAAAGALFGACLQQFGPPQATPTNFNLGRPEVQVIADRERAADLGLSVRDVGFIVSAAVEGAYVGEYRFAGGATCDIRLKIKGQEGRPTQEIGHIPIYTPAGRVVPLSAAVTFRNTTALEQIYRVERQRAVALKINPPETTTLEAAVDALRETVAQLREARAIPPDVTVTSAGNADKLVKARETMVGEWRGWTFATLINIVSSRFFLSVLVVYLLIAALYESWVYPLVIMFSVPLAMFGGFLGLTLAHWGTLLTTDQPVQQLDVVTFLGFVILVGTVVNNAILLVDQALQNLRHHGLAPLAAIRQSVATRVRPILMTALTTIAGQLPLALFPGAGSELYRGLAAVMIMGLLISTLGTLLLVPAVLAFVFDLQAAVARRLGRAPWWGAPRVAPVPADVSA